jgi:HAD superfamily phosphatase (TIGR01668 family)
MLNLFRPHRVVRGIHELDARELIALGICGVMIDLDNTLAPLRSQDVTPAVEAWCLSLADAGLRGCVVTNASNEWRVRPVAERLGLPWVIKALKPLARGFLDGMRLLRTTPDTTVMIGDQLFTDIYGGNRLGLHTVLVEPLSTYDGWPTERILRPLERWIGRMPRRG